MKRIFPLLCSLLLAALLLPAVSMAATKTLDVGFSYPDNTAAKFRLYQDGTAIADVADPARAMQVDVDVKVGTYLYTMTALDAAGNESAPSAPYKLIFTKDDLLPAPAVTKADATIKFGNSKIPDKVVQGVQQ